MSDSETNGSRLTIQDWTKKAEGYCAKEKFQDPRKVSEIERNLESVNKALQIQKKK